MPSGDLVPRQATGCTDIKQAEAVRAALINQQPKQNKGNTAHRPTITECAEKYLASRRHELGDKTIGQHRLLLNRLREFCEARNAVYMRNLTVDLLETFKTEGLPAAMADTSKATAVAKQALFAYVDALAKVILSTLPDTDEDTRKAAAARGKLRYSRFRKSVGANMVGYAQAALSELVNCAPEE